MNKVEVTVKGTIKKEFEEVITIEVSDDDRNRAQKNIIIWNVHDFNEIGDLLLEESDASKSIYNQIKALYPDYIIDIDKSTANTADLDFFTVPKYDCCKYQYTNFCPICGKKLE